jgi:hypothetical protein
MLLRSLLKEAPDTADLDALKAIISGKIKGLPADDATIKALREIEDLLKNVNAGGKMGIINNELASIKDPAVDQAQKLIARYILSIDMEPAQRDELFTLWRSDKLIKHNVLLDQGKKHNFADIVTSYGTNPAIKEIANDLMRVAALGQGKGEFGLNVMSKSISKPDKGDLMVGKVKVECKTTDGGAGRFTDQEVRPGNGFEAAATALNKFVKDKLGNEITMPASGLSIKQAIAIKEYFEAAEMKEEYESFFTQLENLVTLIFGGSGTANAASVNDIIDGIYQSNLGAALQSYSQASFNYYMSKKDDDGVLYMNLTTDPISSIWFKTAEELSASGVRLHAGTAYLTSTKDVRLPYPQMEIVDTTFGANAAAKAEKDAVKQQAKADKEQAKAAKQQAKAEKTPSGTRLTNTSGPRQLK